MHTESVIALGNFDGVHLGHQEVVRTCVRIAKAKRLRPIVLTFNPHPASILSNGAPYEMIMDRQTKLQRVYQLDAEVVELDFTADFSCIPPEQFIYDIVVKKFKPHAVVTGRNFRFGHKKQGDAQQLRMLAQKYEFDYCPLNQIYCDYQPISSSAIKLLLKSGSICTANAMLSVSYQIAGIVQQGEKIAHTLGFPTANLDWPAGIVKPAFGVYAVQVIVDQHRLFGIANIGVRPTFNSDSQCLLEVHILDYSNDLYGKAIAVEFLNFIRPERNFPTKEALIGQIRMDIEAAKQIV